MKLGRAIAAAIYRQAQNNKASLILYSGDKEEEEMHTFMIAG